MLAIATARPAALSRTTEPEAILFAAVTASLRAASVAESVPLAKSIVQPEAPARFLRFFIPVI